MEHRIPVSIRPLLHEYMNLLETEVPGLVTGLYLHGSVALDAFDEHQSDIDFVAFLSKAATQVESHQLRGIHEQITAHYSQILLEGSYIQWYELGLAEEKLSPGPVHHDNHFEAKGVFDVNWVTWWVLKQHGITLIGEQASDLPYSVDWELLTRAMRANMNSYWVSYTYKPNRMAWLLSDYGIEWVVLGVLRQYYSFVAMDITSKIGAGEYALDHLPQQWHRLIREALRIRRREQGSLYDSTLWRAVEGQKFLRYLINYCNSLPISPIM